MKVFFIYSILLSVFVFIGTFSAYFLKTKEFYILTVKLYTLTEYILFAIFLQLNYLNKTAKSIIIFSIFPFLFFCIYDFFLNGSRFSPYPLLIEFMAFIIFIIYFFYERMKIIESTPTYLSINFWICVGLFLYFTGNFFFLICSNNITDKILINQIRYIYTLVTITKNIILSCALFANDFTVINNNEVFNPPADLNLDLESFTPIKNIN